MAEPAEQDASAERENSAKLPLKSREIALWSVGASLIALVFTADSLGAHLHSRGRPGWWEYGNALLWWGGAVWGWWGALRSHRRETGNRAAQDEDR